jgi:hypothetical protein
MLYVKLSHVGILTKLFGLMKRASLQKMNVFCLFALEVLETITLEGLMVTPKEQLPRQRYLLAVLTLVPC